MLATLSVRLSMEPFSCGWLTKSIKVSNGKMTVMSDHRLVFWIFSDLNVSPSTLSNSFVSTTQTKPCNSNSTNSFSNSNKLSMSPNKSNGPSFPSLITKTVSTQFNKRRRVCLPCLTTNVVCHEVLTETLPSVCSINGCQKRTKLSRRIPDYTLRRCNKPRPSLAFATLLVSWNTEQKRISWKRIRTRCLSLQRIFWKPLLRNS
mmetsp:Transcript_22631/g.55931  ORF Transcript_22631/g.55931 Transcript_22631/m.55931 type:complete len:204 (+) Transcript_22631:1495-2106(+)